MRSLRPLALDLLLIAVATAAAVMVRDNFEIVEARLVTTVPYLMITLLIAGFVLPLLGINRSLRQFTSINDYLRILVATIITVAGAVAIGFFVNRLDSVARALPIIQGLLIVAFLVGARVLTQSRGRRIRSAPAQTNGGETVLVIGLNKLTELYLQCLAEFDTGRVKIAGLLGEGGRVGLSMHSHPVLGTPEQVANALRYLEVRGVYVNRIIVAMPRNDLPVPVQEALTQIEETKTICLEFLTERLGMPPLGAGSPGSLTEHPAKDSSAIAALKLPWKHVLYCHVKRLIDVIASAALMILLAPVFVIVGLLVVVNVGLPVIFWQQRPGLRGRPFKLYKFCSMADSYDTDGRRKCDGERVSGIGTFLRRTRLDELPQILNILKGDMSFVGPRPLLPVDQPIDSTGRLLVRPGLTGWAQIKGGRQISATDKAALDVWYVRNMSLALDIEILLGTIPMVIFGEHVTETAIVQARRDLTTGRNSPPLGSTVDQPQGGSRSARQNLRV